MLFALALERLDHSITKPLRRHFRTHRSGRPVREPPDFPFAASEVTVKTSIDGTVENLRDVPQLIKDGEFSISAKPITSDEIPEGLELPEQGKVPARLVAMAEQLTLSLSKGRAYPPSSPLGGRGLLMVRHYHLLHHRGLLT